MNGRLRPKTWIRIRMLVSILLLVGMFAVVISKAYRLQAVQGPQLREMAEQQYLRLTKLPPRRGTIYDKNGTPLAVSVDVDSVYANPRMIGGDAASVARQLGQVLDLDRWALEKQLSSRKYFAWIKRRVGPRQARAVRELKIRGVFLTKESRRFYPNHGLGGSVVGFAGLDAKGLEGIELSHDSWLRGTAARVAGLRDALGRAVMSEGIEHASPSSGHDLWLTLDKFIQYETEQAIKEAYREVRPKTGWVAALVMDPRNGDILAMASEPSFDPNRYQQAKPWQWRNRVVTDTFEPGSTLKIFTLAAALERNLVNQGEVFDCERGAWRVGHYTIHDSHRYDQLDLSGIMKKSSNIGAAKVAFRLGKPKLYASLRRFGFGSRSGISLPGERSGILRKPSRWSDVGLANIAFGQGMTATALQLAQALTAVGNEGVMMRPRIVRSIRNSQGKTVKAFGPKGFRLLKPWVAKKILRMMVGVTEPGGTGEDAAMERFTVAGKTGTAQKVDPVTGTYATDRWLSSFMGLVPASRPRLAAVVVVNEPAGEKHYGGEVAGPVFKRILSKALGYLGVRPDRHRPLAKEQKQPRPVSVARDGYLDTDPAPPLPDAETAVGAAILVPDFTGMSITEVISEARRAGLKVELMGSGRAVAQSPGPGPAGMKTTCRVSFRPPG